MNKTTHRVRNDLFLLLSFLLVAALIFGIFYLTRRTGEHVVVSLDGEVVATYPLSLDRTEVLCTGVDGTGRNTLVIAGGVAYMREASCPDGICVGHRPISFVGETVVCLPNRLVISIEE